MDQTFCALANSCLKNDCIINQVCSGLLSDSDSTSKFVNESVTDLKNRDLRLNLLETLHNKLQISPLKSLSNSFKKSSEVSILNPTYFQATDITYSEVPSVIFDVLKSDVLHDSINTSFLNQNDDILQNNEISCLEQEFSEEKSTIKGKVTYHSLENINKSVLLSVPTTIHDRPNSVISECNLDRDLVFELDEKLHINQIHEDFDGQFLPEEIVEAPLDISEENLNKPKLRPSNYLSPLSYNDNKLPPSKQMQICKIKSFMVDPKKSFTVKIFDVKNSKSSLNKSSLDNDQLCIEKIFPVSNLMVMDNVSEQNDVLKEPSNAYKSSTQTKIWSCRICFQLFDNRVDHTMHKEEKHKIKIIPQTLENSCHSIELKPKLIWNSSFKTVPSPQCMVIKNASTFSCNVKLCGAEFFCNKELVLHMKDQHSGSEIESEQKLVYSSNKMKKRRHPVGGLDDVNENEDNFKKKIKIDSSAHKEYDGSLKECLTPVSLYIKKRNQQRPLLFDYKERLYKCGRFDCSAKFSSVENLKLHIDCHDFSKYSAHTFICIYCKKLFNKWTNCSLHLWKVHGQNIDLLACGICKTYKTNLPGKMAIHQETHSNDKPYKCEFCGRIFKQNSQLKTHICKQRPIEEQPLWAQRTLCNECNKWFTSYKNYVQHYNAIHLKIKKFSCSHCNYQCYMKIHFTTHMRKHTKVKPYTCELCGLSVADHNSIRRHRLTHIPKRKMDCPINSCSYSTVNIPMFKMHLLQCHPNAKFKFTCQICSFDVSNLEEYLKHRNFHEKEFIKIVFAKDDSKYDGAACFKDRVVERQTLSSNDSSSSKKKFVAAKIKSNDDVMSMVVLDKKMPKNKKIPPTVIGNDTDFSSKLKNTEADTKITTLNDLYYSDKRFVKKRKMEENLCFETVLLIE